MFKAVSYPGVENEAPVADHPLRYSRVPVGEFQRAPLLGEHTDSVLANIGFSDQEISRFRELGTI
jgi:crotonobetainyl-CoA:carnitine CoA-transferase CaiB-like acyl-CoA transferase